MKKVYVENVTLKVQVPESKVSYKFVVNNHSFIKEINNKLAVKMGLNPFQTEFEFHTPYGQNKINIQSTLQQNNIDSSNNVLNAKLKFCSKTKFQASKQSKKQLNNVLKSQSIECSDINGLVVNAICSNPICIDFQKEKRYDLGFGSFDMFCILNNTKCPNCPYKDIGLQPSAAVCKITLNNCIYQYQVFQRHVKGFEIQAVDQPFTKSYGLSDDTFEKIVLSKEWSRVHLITKQL